MRLANDINAKRRVLKKRASRLGRAIRKERGRGA
jgi:hypothetical protein